MKLLVGAPALLAITCLALGQSVHIDPAADAKEASELQQAMQEAGFSQVDQMRALEAHLKKYPESKQRPAIEQTLAKVAMDTSDNERIILYGEKVLARSTPPDLTGDIPQLLDRVIRALVDKENPDRAKRAVVYAERYEADIAEARTKVGPPGHLTPVQWQEELDKANARALALEARATGYSGDAQAAAKIARQSWQAHPTGEGARETGYWLSLTGRKEDAIEFYADAFTIEDARNTEQDRAQDRAQLGRLYKEIHGSEKGLGDVILAAYDRTSGMLNNLRAGIKAKDPNSVATSLAEFTLPPVNKEDKPLAIASLKGKTVVMDFWATWCAPCRAQQPLIENVRTKYAKDPDVLFLSVDSDDDTSIVAPFITEQGWKTGGYFEAGLARALNIASIPTVLILDRNGNVASRMIGFIPERFEQMLAERVDDARKVSQP
jgi:thiol-disulfide isomerase/thioredoxin